MCVCGWGVGGGGGGGGVSHDAIFCINFKLSQTRTSIRGSGINIALPALRLGC